MLNRLFNPNDLIGCGGDINQSKSVPMMSLNVMGNINQSNSRHLCRSPWVVVGKINQSKSVSMMSLNVVGNINQSNSRHLHGSPWVVSAGGLNGWSLWVSTGSGGEN